MLSTLLLTCTRRFKEANWFDSARLLRNWFTPASPPPPFADAFRVQFVASELFSIRLDLCCYKIFKNFNFFPHHLRSGYLARRTWTRVRRQNGPIVWVGQDINRALCLCLRTPFERCISAVPSSCNRMAIVQLKSEGQVYEVVGSSTSRIRIRHPRTRFDSTRKNCFLSIGWTW